MVGVMMEERYGYTNTNNILYVVHDHKRRPASPVDDNVYTGPGFCLPDEKQMFTHPPRNLHFGHLLIPRVV